LKHIQSNRVAWENLRNILDWSVGRSANALLEKLHGVLELIELGARLLILTFSLLFLSQLTWTLKHIVIDDEVHRLFISNEKHVNHSVAINVCKIKNLVILNV
jgi:hypothetical protein